ncbi:MAG TPA: Abi family protein [Kribbella sp.]|uniref:Abi family protein n=1 Tax=Actinomycetes TaxID=1760 RepID=UPI002C754772|nr:MULTISPECIES: Abi family protein [Actinomycetes]HET6294972.1 Abi family protein [Kribbella sp.]HTF53940.1 Abi family protein [Pseudonocardia sp.]
MAGTYIKPHRTYEEQLKLLQGRGLEVSDEEAALRLLRTVGYYRLSAYVYPFREMLPRDQRTLASPTHYRSETITPGTEFSGVESLWRFDRKLRLLVLDAVETVEIGLRTKISYVLGARDKFGHLNIASLNESVCVQPRRRDRRTSDTRHQVWLSGYERSIRESGQEDFLRHNLHKYEELPVWIAVEVLTFGALVRLFNLMRQEDQTLIARELGVKGGPLLGGWLEAVNYLRNVAAHHARLWNRSMTYKIRKFNQHQVGSDLLHLANQVPIDKVYSSLAVSAYLLRQIDPGNSWPRTLMTHVRKFPAETGMSPTNSMGFPVGWDGQALWNAQ